jgi:hypothetical protein
MTEGLDDRGPASILIAEVSFVRLALAALVLLSGLVAGNSQTLPTLEAT